MWGTVCDDNWDIADARVVCRMLGFTDVISALDRAFFGKGKGKIWLDEVKCTGTETSLFDCVKNPWGKHNCQHGEDASVVCSPPSVRLRSRTNSYSGRVELRYNGSWGTVCDNDWDINDASVICRMFGFANASFAFRGVNIGRGTGKIWFDDFRCTGSEASIWNCTKIVTNEICDLDKDAAVVCRPITVRLVNGSNSHSGRVEVNYLGEWGTVCHYLWDINDAHVVCRMLGFSNATSAHASARFGQGTGRIWLNNVMCKGTEESLWDCTKDTWTGQNCNHNHDASVVCTP